MLPQVYQLCLALQLQLQKVSMGKFFKNQTPNIQIQIGAMKAKFPQFRCTYKAGKLIFIGELLIKPELPIYKVSVEYRGNLRPLVHVISPTLVADTRHVHVDGSLWLYYPVTLNLHGKKIIAKEII